MWETPPNKVGNFKPLTEVTDVGRGGNTIQVSEKQPTKGKEKTTKYSIFTPSYQLFWCSSMDFFPQRLKPLFIFLLGVYLLIWTSTKYSIYYLTLKKTFLTSDFPCLWAISWALPFFVTYHLHEQSIPPRNRWIRLCFCFQMRNLTPAFLGQLQ